MEKHGSTAEHFAKIAWKNHKHSVNNPYSQFQVKGWGRVRDATQDEYTLEQIKASPMMHAPLTKLQVQPRATQTLPVLSHL